MRPTIPFFDWRIAVALKQTASLPDFVPMPARTCDCEECRFWRETQGRAMPQNVVRALARLGINAAHPADLYAFERSATTFAFRLKYYLVGKVLEGPEAFRQESSGRMNLYLPLTDACNDILVNVYPARLSNLPEPHYDGMGGDLIVVDVRLKASAGV